MTTLLIATNLSVKPSVVSHHLVWLARMGLVLGMKSGRCMLYAPNRLILKNLGVELIGVSALPSLVTLTDLAVDVERK